MSERAPISAAKNSALIESLEGKPGKPRIRPPFPMAVGYLGKPTVVNNVETLAEATVVALQGGPIFAGHGTRHSAGTKILSVLGDCARPGIYEYPFGVRVEQALRDCGASDVAAVQISGPSGVCLTPDEFRRPSPSRTCLRLARSRFSARSGTSSRSRAISPISSPMKAAASVPHATSARR